MFILQAVTGSLLAMTYDPSPNGAYQSIRYITDQQTLGWLLRGMHKWGASMMVILLFLHMARVFFYGAYKYPRELTWLTGSLIFILTMMMGLTGYLLVWDERAYWASVVAVNINGTAPVLGPFISKFLLAGPVFGAQTISRFYALHMLLIPGAIGALIFVHMWLVVKLGVTPWPSRPLPEPEPSAVPAARRVRARDGGGRVSARKVINRKVRYETQHAAEVHEGHEFFPYAMFHDVVVNLIVVLMIVAMAVVWHATAGPINAAHPNGQNGLFGALYEQQANPAVQSTEPRPEWYFLFLFELLRIFKTPAELILATIIIPTIWMVLLVAWPFLDRGRDRRLSRRPWGVAIGLSVPAVLIALTIAGAIAPGVASGSNVTTIPALNALPGAADDLDGRLYELPQLRRRWRQYRRGPLARDRRCSGPTRRRFRRGSPVVPNKATHIMPDYTSLGPTTIAQIAQLVASLKTGKVEPLQQ